MVVVNVFVVSTVGVLSSPNSSTVEPLPGGLVEAGSMGCGGPPGEAEIG
jgi:hypothetical protein